MTSETMFNSDIWLEECYRILNKANDLREELLNETKYMHVVQVDKDTYKCVHLIKKIIFTFLVLFFSELANCRPQVVHSYWMSLLKRILI